MPRRCPIGIKMASMKLEDANLLREREIKCDERPVDDSTIKSPSELKSTHELQNWKA